MIPWTLLETAEVPTAGGELRLFRRGAEFSIRLGRNELMNSRVHGSEEALAQIAIAKIEIMRGHESELADSAWASRSVPRSALLPQRPKSVVAELVPAVVAWNRSWLAGISDRSLADVRVSIREVDVANLIASDRSAYDAILLDVDNGPEALTREANDRLYDLVGLGAAYAALRPRGVLAAWSAGPDRDFTRRLRKAGFEVNEVRIRARGAHGGAHHMIWTAIRS